MVARVLLLLCCLSMAAKKTIGWCGRSDEGDCFLAIRTGGSREAGRSLARGIQFVHEPLHLAPGQEEVFGHLAAVPNDGGEEAQLRFAIGGGKPAKLMGNGMFEVGGVKVEEEGMSSSVEISASGVELMYRKNASSSDFLAYMSERQSSASFRLAKSGLEIESRKCGIRLDAIGESVLVQGTKFENLAGNSIMKTGEVDLGEEWAIKSGDEGFQIANVGKEDTRQVVFLASDAPRYSIALDKEGNLGIGIRWPTVKLDVNGGIQGTSAYSSASDRRWKSQISNLENSLEKLQKIRPVRFEFRHEEFPEKGFPHGPQLGFIAQEMENIYPEVVQTSHDGMKSLQYASLVPVLVDAIQTLQKEHAKMKLEIERLRAEISALTDEK